MLLPLRDFRCFDYSQMMKPAFKQDNEDILKCLLKRPTFSFLESLNDEERDILLFKLQKLCWAYNEKYSMSFNYDVEDLLQALNKK